MVEPPEITPSVNVQLCHQCPNRPLMALTNDPEITFFFFFPKAFNILKFSIGSQPERQSRFKTSSKKLLEPYAN